MIAMYVLLCDGEAWALIISVFTFSGYTGWVISFDWRRIFVGDGYFMQRFAEFDEEDGLYSVGRTCARASVQC